MFPLRLISASITSCISSKLLLYNDSAAIVLMVIPKLSNMLVSMLLTNLPPLSATNMFGDPNIDILLLKIYLTTVSGCLFGMTAHAKGLLQLSTMCKIILFLKCFISIAAVFRNVLLAIERVTTGLGRDILRILQVQHDF